MFLKTDRKIFTTMLVAVIDTTNKMLTFSNAGQTSPIFKRQGQVQQLKVEGIHFPLGMKEDVAYDETALQLQSGDTLVFYTDGFSEAMNQAKEIFGSDRMEVAIKKLLSSLSAKEIVSALFKEAEAFAGSAKQHDDMTVVVVKVVDLKLHGCGRVTGWSWQGRNDEVEQRPEIFGVLVQISFGNAGTGIGIDDRELELFLCGIEVDKQVVNFVEDLGNARIRTVDFVDADNRWQPSFQSFFQHKPCLWQRTFRGIDEEHDTVHHCQCPFNLATEVSVTRRVHEVDLHPAVRDRCVLGQDRDSSFTFEDKRVHNPVNHLFFCVEDPTLTEQGIDERSFTVVNVSNDSDIANVVASRNTALQESPPILLKAER